MVEIAGVKALNLSQTGSKKVLHKSELSLNTDHTCEQCQFSSCPISCLMITISSHTNICLEKQGRCLNQYL